MTWQPIESAPRDVPVMVWDGSAVGVAMGIVYMAGSSEAYVEGMFNGEYDWAIHHATHWKPLPAPPEDDGSVVVPRYPDSVDIPDEG